MNIREAILAEHSKMQSDLIAGYIGNRQRRFDELMALVFTNEEPIARRAAWTMGHCCREHPELIAPHLERLVNFIAEPDTHQAIIRNSLLIMQAVEIPSELEGRIFNLCYDHVNEPDQMAAARVYAMSILAKICQSEPELVGEVELLIQQHFKQSSAGFKSRARQVLRRLRKIS